jgi:hypothetical protein
MKGSIHLRPRPWLVRTSLALIALLSLASSALAINGSIGSLAIEIDQNANLHPASNFPSGYGGNGAILNPGATVDWVQDNLNNVGTNCLSNSVASCNEANVTAAVGGVGHWYGARIVDGIAGNDQDIFLNGGKENDVTTWNVGPGTVGSSKYDATQAYLANNNQTVFFGMERRGNNGTTAFDFEFNRLGTEGTYVPVRSVGDVLFTFEMQGSGGSGSAVAHVFRWDGSSYVEQTPLPAGLISSINTSVRPSAPWGTVNSHGDWVLSDIDRFEFAEAAAPLSVLNVNGCGGFAFVQVRTRSSSSPTSDLKDTTKIFRYVFGGPTARALLSTSCNQDFTYDGSTSTNSNGGTTGLSYSWVFTPTTGVSLSGGGVTGPDSNGAYHSTQITGTVAVSLPSGVNSTVIPAELTVTEGTGCTHTAGPVSITVYRQLAATASKTSADGTALSVTLTGSAATATGLQWQRFDGTNWVNIPNATGTTLTYSSFETDTTPTATTFTIGSDSYTGQLYTVQLRLHAVRNVGGVLCEADSAAVTVKKVRAVDP